jgi:glycosyltransferase involved in cell wall biosynthesis
MEKLLAICIPTYNRRILLERCLDSVRAVANSYPNDISVVIANNSSTDNTAVYLTDIEKSFPSVRIIHNETNLGTEGNFEKLLLAVKDSHRYMFLLSDDDFLVPEFFLNVVQFLRNNTVGVLYVNNATLGAEISSISPTNDEFLTGLTLDAYISKVGFWVTFISGNIFNLQAFSGKNPRADQIIKKYKGTMLNYLYWYLLAGSMSTQNAIYNRVAVLAEPNNSGGYSVARVFGWELPRIFRLERRELGISATNTKQLKKSLLFNLLDHFRTNTSFKTHLFDYYLVKTYWQNVYFWKYFARKQKTKLKRMKNILRKK